MTGPSIQDVGSGIQTGADASGPDGVQPWAAPSVPNQGLQAPREAALWTRLRLRHLTAAGNGVDLAIGAGATSLAVVFEREEPNTDYGVTVTPGWSTTAYVPAVDKSTTGFTARFGTAAPGGGSIASFTTFRSEDS